MFKTKKKQTQKHSFHICVSFCWFFSEEGLTSCYKNIFIFITIVELQDKSSVRNTAPAKVRLQCHFNSTSPFSLSLSVSVPVFRCCSPTSSNKWVQTGMWYWRQCSWYFLSVMSQFSTEWRWGTMVNTVRGHSGMENTDAPSINKVIAITAATLKMEKALLLRLNVPHPFLFIFLTDANWTFLSMVFWQLRAPP